MNNSVREIYKRSAEQLAQAGVDSHLLDTQILLEHTTHQSRSFLLAHPEFELTQLQQKKFESMAEQRAQGEPIAYITGHKEFYGLDFIVTPDVLIPRPESEYLVEQAIEFIQTVAGEFNQNITGISKNLNNKENDNSKPAIKSGVKKMLEHYFDTKKINILDVGTGSGCIIISLANSLCHSVPPSLCHSVPPSLCNLFATDISKKALAVAKKNAKMLLSNGAIEQWNNGIAFFHSDLFSNKKMPRNYDLIIANLPYVPIARIKSAEIGGSELRIKPEQAPLPCHSREGGNPDKIPDQAGDDISFEPSSAIFADDNGTAIIKRFLSEAVNRLTPHGAILIELDPRNAAELLEFAKKLYPNAKIESKKDLSGWDRYLIIGR